MRFLNMMEQKNSPNLSPFGRYGGVWLSQTLVDFSCFFTIFEGWDNAVYVIA
jgi:putative flippase GtrA